MRFFYTGYLPDLIVFRATNDSSVCPPDGSFLQPQRPNRPQASTSGTIHHISRPLSSADEAGPVAKKLRSTSRQPIKPKTTKPSEDPLKKARARPALKFANIFSSSGRRSQPTIASRIAPTGLGKTELVSSVATRRSTRLLTGNGSKPAIKVRPTLHRYI